MNATSSGSFTTAWEATARDLLAQEWHRFVHSNDAGANRQPLIAGPIAWIVPELLDLVVQNHDRPVTYLAPRVHHILTEANFVEESGGGAAPLTPEEIDQQTQRIVEVLEQVRCAALADSRWSDAPVTPIMFG